MHQPGGKESCSKHPRPCHHSLRIIEIFFLKSILAFQCLFMMQTVCYSRYCVGQLTYTYIVKSVFKLQVRVAVFLSKLRLIFFAVAEKLALDFVCITERVCLFLRRKIVFNVAQCLSHCDCHFMTNNLSRQTMTVL